MKYLLLISMLLLVSSAFAVNFEAYAQMNVRADSINYGSGIHRWGQGGFRADGSNWDVSLLIENKRSGEGAVVPRYLTNSLSTTLESRIKFGNFTVNPEVNFQIDMDSVMVVLPLSLGEGYRNQTLSPALSMRYTLPQVFEINISGRQWGRDVLVLDSDSDTEWSNLLYSGDILWHTPIGGYLAVGGLSHQTKLEALDYDQSWSRIDVAAGYTPLQFPTRTIVTAEAEYSLYSGDDYTGSALPNRFTARLRAVQEITRKIVCNVTFSQAADMYEDDNTFGPFQSAIRTKYKFDGWGNSPSSITVTGQLTESVISTKLATLERRISLYSGFSALVTGKLWNGPSSDAGTGGYRTREIIGGGLEFRMNNGLNTFVIYEREASDLTDTEVWGRIRGGLGFYPAQF